MLVSTHVVQFILKRKLVRSPDIHPYHMMCGTTAKAIAHTCLAHNHIARHKISYDCPFIGILVTLLPTLLQ